MQIDELMKKLTNAVSYQYKKDKTAAGIVISLLNNGEYYTSIVRYTAAFSKGKEVVARARSRTLYDALVELSDNFVNLDQKYTPMDELKDFIQTDDEAKPYVPFTLENDDEDWLDDDEESH